MVATRLRVLVAIGAVLLGVALPAGAAHADPAGDFFSQTNSLRASKGVAPLGWDSRMVAIAQRWASHMAATQTLSHNTDLPNEIPSDWEKYGENVGTGPSVSAIQQAFVNSPHHYANLVDPDFAVVGIAVVTDSRGALWVVEDFLLEAAPPPSRPPPAPAPPVTSSPAPPPATAPVPVVPPPPTSTTTTSTTTTTTTIPAPAVGDVATELSGLDARS